MSVATSIEPCSFSSDDDSGLTFVGLPILDNNRDFQDQPWLQHKNLCGHVPRVYVSKGPQTEEVGCMLYKSKDVRASGLDHRGSGTKMVTSESLKTKLVVA